MKGQNWQYSEEAIHYSLQKHFANLSHPRKVFGLTRPLTTIINGPILPSSFVGAFAKLRKSNY
jgi:hypothetical protein